MTLTIPRGMYGLLGPNGAGKSTNYYIDRNLADSVVRFAGPAK